jgi:hypothetical protein
LPFLGVGSLRVRGHGLDPRLDERSPPRSDPAGHPGLQVLQQFDKLARWGYPQSPRAVLPPATTSARLAIENRWNAPPGMAFASLGEVDGSTVRNQRRAGCPVDVRSHSDRRTPRTRPTMPVSKRCVCPSEPLPDSWDDERAEFRHGSTRNSTVGAMRTNRAGPISPSRIAEIRWKERFRRYRQRTVETYPTVIGYSRVRKIK